MEKLFAPIWLQEEPSCGVYNRRELQKREASLLKLAGREKNLALGICVHSHINLNKRIEDNGVYLGNLVIEMYGKCGTVDRARRAFDDMGDSRNVSSWNAMLKAYVRNGQFQEAKHFYESMDIFAGNACTYSSVLHACSSISDVRFLHAQIVESFLDTHDIVGNALVSAYAKWGDLLNARQVFDGIECKSTISWISMIRAYTHSGYMSPAFNLYRRMNQEGFENDFMTLSCIVVACPNLAECRAIHHRIVACGLDDVFLHNSLITMYSKCGSLQDAREVFENMQGRNVVSWTVIITAYARKGHVDEALKLYKTMDVLPNGMTFATVLAACSYAGPVMLIEGKFVHISAMSSGFGSCIEVQNALVNMYAKCGSLQEAQEVFEKMEQRDVVCWTTMMATYTQQGDSEKALELFRRMDLEGVKPDFAAFVHALSACSSLSAGKLIHSEIVLQGCEVTENMIVSTGLVNMYGLHGKVGEASKVFEKMQKKDVTAWSTMIGAYAQHGYAADALHAYNQMQAEGIKPHAMALTSILKACNHAGLVRQARNYLLFCVEEAGELILGEHYECMIDLLARAGWLKEAEELIDNMPFQPSALAWGSLLRACSSSQRDVSLGEKAANRLRSLDPYSGLSFVMLSNTYRSNS